MPATEVSPALRRRISDDARELLRSALEPPGVHPTAERLEQRLQNFRGRLRLELLAAEGGAALSSLELRLAVTDASFLARYLVASMGVEVSVASRAGVTSSWLTLPDGRHQQLQDALDDPAAALDAVKRPARSLLAMLDLLDLRELLAACANAVAVCSGSHEDGRRAFYAVGGRNSYVLAFDRATGQPLSVTLAPLDPHGSEPPPARLRLVFEQYARFWGQVLVPRGVKSDVQLVIDAAMAGLARWSPAGRRRLARVFEALDADADGRVSARDVERQLADGAGQSAQQAARVAAELARLLGGQDGDGEGEGGSSDPAEEFSFREFAGFWIATLADGHAASDPRNEPGVLAAIDALFFGA